MCRSFFYAVLTYCALPITVTARSWSKNENFSLYGEKVREEKEGESRLWERCENPLAVFHGFHSRSEGEKGEVGFITLCRSIFQSVRYRDIRIHHTGGLHKVWDSLAKFDFYV